MTALEDIKKALEGVTPGPWQSKIDAQFYFSIFAGDFKIATARDILADRGYANTRYIAAVNPAAISELLSTLESLQRENEELVARANEAVEAANALQVRTDTAEAEVARLLAEIDRKSSMPGDHRYWEGRYRDEAAENDRLNAILEPFRTVSKDWVDENGWTDVACQKDRIVDWFGPSDFRSLQQALDSTGGEHHGN